MKKNNPITLMAWCMYDWANSVYSLVITSTLFPVYYGAVAKGVDGGELVTFFGVEIKNSVLYSYAISASFLTAGLLSPVLSGIADYTGLKKRFMQFFCYLGGASCAGLYFFDQAHISLGVILFALATVSYSGSIVFYNSYLPDIATEDRFDGLSSRGFAVGYIGSLLLLMAILMPILLPEQFGNPDSGLVTRWGFVATGVWWIGFAQISFYHLPKGHSTKARLLHAVSKGWQELKATFNNAMQLVPMKRFLLSFFLYNMGVQTVMYLAAIFGDKELGLPSSALILTILILQIVAIAGVRLFAWLSKLKGNVFALSVAIVIWIGICAGAYFTTTENQFYVLAGFVGLVMGGIQSLSRSTFAKLIPAGSKDTASFFSFYDLVEKGSIVLGTASYGLIDQLTGSMRYSALFLMVYFVAGLWLLSRVYSHRLSPNLIINKQRKM
jgi:UMF1 family MFS transporter